MKRMATILATIVLAASTVTIPVSAVPSDDVIKTNCSSAQSILNQMETADAALRINRGRVYNEVLELFYAMNSRLASNKISAPKLVEITSDFESELDDFRSDYNSYDDDLTKVIEMNCQEQPSDWYDKLTDLRESRANLNDKIVSLDQLVDDYQTEFDTSVRVLIDAK